MAKDTAPKLGRSDIVTQAYVCVFFTQSRIAPNVESLARKVARLLFQGCLLIQCLLAPTIVVASDQLCPEIVGNETRLALLKTKISQNSLVALVRHTEAGAEIKRQCKEPTMALTLGGRRQAQALREGLRILQITGARVTSSDYCRTLQTAEIVFGPCRDAKAVDARLGVGCTKQGIIDLVSKARQTALNLVLVTHSNCIANFIADETDAVDALGITVFLSWDGNSALETIGCMRLDDWSGLPL